MSELQIPPGTQPGDVLVLAKKGAPKLNKPSIRGDHLFTIKVTIPKRVRYVLISFCHVVDITIITFIVMFYFLFSDAIFFVVFTLAFVLLFDLH